MTTPASPIDESFEGEPFTLSVPKPSALPVLIAVPHAGRAYSPDLLARMRAPDETRLRLEDRLVDRLAVEVAARTGAGLLVAHAPRALIDLNPAPDEVDWSMVSGGGKGVSGARARGGLGLVPRRLPGIGELWSQPIPQSQLAERLSRVHAPYHVVLGRELVALRRRWGAALLLDLHSMPPLPSRAGQAAASFVLGDRFGASCNGRIIAEGIATLAATGHGVAHNRPYAGGYVIGRHGEPRQGLHALQLEIDRSRYLDSRFEEPGEGWAETVDSLVILVRKLAAQVAEIARNPAQSDWPEAAQ